MKSIADIKMWATMMNGEGHFAAARYLDEYAELLERIYDLTDLLELEPMPKDKLHG